MDCLTPMNHTLVYQHLSHESQLLRCQQVCQKDVNYTIVCHHFPYETVATVAIWPAKAVATSEVLAAHTVLSVNGLRSTTACSSTLRYGPSRLNKGILHGHFHREHADENVIKDDMSLVNPCCVSQKEHSRIARVISHPMVIIKVVPTRITPTATPSSILSGEGMDPGGRLEGSMTR